jgi:hypothetical protein
MGSEETSDCLSLAGLRALAIPMDDEDQWDHGELPHAVLNLENQTALSECCSLLLRLSIVERRSLDETKESRAVALREVLLELMPKELDHPYCSALRALAGLEPGTAGRNRERRQQVAGVALGTERHPATTRTVRRRVKEDCWPWLFDRLMEREVRERRAREGGDSERIGNPSPQRSTMELPGWAARYEWDEHGGDDPAIPKELPPWEVWPVSTGHTSWLDVANRLAQLYGSRVRDELADLADRRQDGAEDGAWLPERGGRLDQQEVNSLPTRREMLGYLGAALMAAGVDQAIHAQGRGLPRVLEALEITGQPNVPKPDPAAVESLNGVVEHYKLAFRSAPPAELYNEVLGVRRYAGSLLDSTPASSSYSDLVVAVGWLSNLLALLTHDLGDPAAAAVWCADAERCSAEAGHPELAGWAAQTRVLMSFYDGQAYEAIAHAERGQQLAPLGTVAHAKLVVQEMRARALLGDTQADMVASTRRRAEQAIARLPSDAPTRGAFSIALADDPPLTATSLLLVGRLQEAEAATRRVIAAFCGSSSEKGQAADPSGFARIYLILGLALAGLGKLDEAHAAGSVALSAPRFVRPTAVLAGRLDRNLRRDFAGTPEARDYHERYVTAVQSQRFSSLLAEGQADLADVGPS